MGDGHQGLPPPDWARIQPPDHWSGRAVDPMGLRGVPSGDSKQWGGVVNQHFVNAAGTGVLEDDAQLIRVQTADQYPRPWMIAGNLETDNATFALDNAKWKCFLEVTQGAGNASLRQLIDLRALVALAAPFYGPVVMGARFSRPWFVNPGALVANNMFARVIQVFIDSTVVDTIITTTAVCTPIAAGWGL